MQHQTDDMDDLFRKAAKEYPLSVAGADWSKVQQKLQQAEPDEKTRRRRIGVIWLMAAALIPAALVMWFLFANVKTGSDSNDVASNSNKVNVTSGSRDQKNFQTPVNGKGLEEKVIFRNEPVTGSVIVTSHKTRSTANPQNAIGRANENDVAEATIVFNNKDAGGENHSMELLAGALEAREVNEIGGGDAVHTNDLTFNITSNTEKTKRFYIGAVAGADATTVRYQRVNRLSNDFGFLLGYNFAKGFSIETGLFSTRKYYFSEGEYFSTSRITLPPNTKITAVDGNCRMLELPLTLRYTFGAIGSRASVAAGLTSYFMKEENYEYTYFYMNSGTSHDVYKSYSTPSTHLAAALNLSAGYTLPAGKFADIRVEPYVRLPLKGVGTGSLPFTSGGLHIGLTKKLF